ncbi:hypothetical protein AA103587_2137 [Gluconobacter kanchanaburiensis NBRC 103587]|nr:hypothetical protein AA103587_2137 [Gluconobacter kanchanaburiensis NBRC 103587]
MAVRVANKEARAADIAKAAARWAAETEVKWAVVAQAAECKIETQLRLGFFLYPSAHFCACSMRNSAHIVFPHRTKRRGRTTMANLPDNFSQSAFDARYGAGNTALDDEYDYLRGLQKAYDAIDVLDDPNEDQLSELLALEDQIADQLITISMMEDA